MQKRRGSKRMEVLDGEMRLGLGKCWVGRGRGRKDFLGFFYFFYFFNVVGEGGLRVCGMGDSQVSCCFLKMESYYRQILAPLFKTVAI